MLKAAARAASAVVLVTLTAVGLWVAFGTGGDDGEEKDGFVTTDQASPTPAGFLTVGEVLPFTCVVRTPSSRPTLSEMSDTYARARFHGTDGLLAPALFALQLSSAYYDPSPSANSAAIEPGNFFRSIPMPTDQCRSPFVHNIRLRDYRPIELVVTAVDPPEAILTVQPEPGVRYDIAFEPRTAPDPKGGVSRQPLARLVVQISGGRPTMEFDFPRFGSKAEYSPTGALVYAKVASPMDVVWMNNVSQRLRILSGAIGAGGATVEVRDRAGKLLSVVQLGAASRSWEQLALIDVPPEGFGMVFGAGMADFGQLLIVPAETALPPDTVGSP